MKNYSVSPEMMLAAMVKIELGQRGAVMVPEVGVRVFQAAELNMLAGRTFERVNQNGKKEVVSLAHPATILFVARQARRDYAAYKKSGKMVKKPSGKFFTSSDKFQEWQGALNRVIKRLETTSVDQLAAKFRVNTRQRIATKKTRKQTRDWTYNPVKGVQQNGSVAMM